MILNIFLVISLTLLRCLSKKFVLLPYNSPICKNTTQNIHKYYEFTINQQINFNTNGNLSEISNILKNFNNNDDNDTRVNPYLLWPQIETDSYQYYLCRALVKPMGRPLDVHNERGEYSFWNVRILIDRVYKHPSVGNNKGNCSDYLLLQFRHKENLVTKLDGHSAKTINITCQDNLPIVVPSSLRKLYLTYFSTDPSSLGYVVNVTSFIYFQGDFSPQYQQDLCRRQDGFWCVNETVCIFREMKCDGFDSCFDGGSDEVDCASANNLTIPISGDKRRKPPAGFIDYLPWLALGILPLILLLALICICNQHRSEVYFDEEEDNLDVEKSHDGEEMWSSGDGLDKLSDCDDRVAEVREGPSVSVNQDQDVPMCLIGPSTHKETTKADIPASRTLQSITNREYEDLDQPAASSSLQKIECIHMNTMNGGNGNGGESLESDTLVRNGGSVERQNVMYMSQMTDDDYEDHLEDVGSLLRKVDHSKIPEEVRTNRPSSSASPPKSSLNETLIGPLKETDGEYRSDYILV